MLISAVCQRFGISSVLAIQLFPPRFKDKTGVPVPIPDVLSMDETQLVDRMMDFVALGT